MTNSAQQTGESNLNFDKLDPIRIRLARAYDIFGKDIVLIPIRYQTKKALVKWGSIERKDTDADEYLAMFADNNGIAVKLGRCSGSLCSIDFDNDEILADFQRLNPWSVKALTTKAARGANIWVRIIGDYEPYMAFGDLGEWRCDGHYTVIAGHHPTGVRYRIMIYSTPYEIAFKDIVWPEKMEELLVERRRQAQHSVSSPNSSEILETVKLKTAELDSDGSGTGELKTGALDTGMLHARTLDAGGLGAEGLRTKGLRPKPLRPPALGPVHCVTKKDTVGFAALAEDGMALSQAMENLAKWRSKVPKELGDLFDIHIGRNHSPTRGGRNAFVVDAAKRLSYAMASEVARGLLIAYYTIYSPYFKDSYKQHLYEVDEALKNVEATYMRELPLDEAKFYHSLTGVVRSTYRILRDLAIVAQSEKGTPVFFMSSRQLGARIGRSHTDASRILKSLCSFIPIIAPISAEQPRFRKATEYMWLMPLPNGSAVAEKVGSKLTDNPAIFSTVEAA